MSPFSRFGGPREVSGGFSSALFLLAWRELLGIIGVKLRNEYGYMLALVTKYCFGTVVWRDQKAFWSIGKLFVALQNFPAEQNMAQSTFSNVFAEWMEKKLCNIALKTWISLQRKVECFKLHIKD